MRSLWTNIDKCEGRRTGRNRYNSDGEIDNYQVKNRYSYIDYKANVVSYCTLRPYEQWEEWRPSNSVGVKNQLSITYSERFLLWYTVVVHKKLQQRISSSMRWGGGGFGAAGTESIFEIRKEGKAGATGARLRYSYYKLLIRGWVRVSIGAGISGRISGWQR